LSGACLNAPSFATIYFRAIDNEASAGKNVLSMLLAAQAAGKPVRLWGSNQCALQGDMEMAVEIEW
jgi:hypothetical protein